MNRQIGYIGQGFLLMLLIVAGIGAGQWLISGRQVQQSNAANTGSSVVVGPSESMLHGEKLFRDNCLACHAFNIDGPRLRDIENRVTDKQLLYDWIRNSEAVLKKGNKYFNGLYNKWNKTGMTSFPSLSDEEIDDMLSYIRNTPNL